MRRPAEGRRRHEPDLDDPAPLEREQCAPDRHAADVVPRPVDRVDDPPSLLARVGSLLLAEHALSRPAARDQLPDGLLRCPICLADRRQVGLGRHLQVARAETRHRDRVGGVGELERELEVRGDVHDL